MSVISLLTDFGLQDPYVGIMKGVILSIHPEAKIVDISHQIQPQDVAQAALILQSAYRFFPDGTIHICVVDPGVGSGRSIVAVQTDRFRFLSPDNGLLGPLLSRERCESVVRVSNPDYTLKTISRTFHGRDIFAPAGAHLARGVAIENLGPPINPKDLLRLSLPEPVYTSDGTLTGTILTIDHFGNLISNITLEDIDKLIGSQTDKLIVSLGRHAIHGLSASYSNVATHHPLAIIGSHGYLEIAVNSGNARQFFQVNHGDPVKLSCFKV